MKKKDQAKSLFTKIRENKVDILIGTQMISKGFNFPKLNCIVVIDADFSGRGYDLRNTEKNIQLYHQLSGRAGRFSSESLIIYQTLSPEDLVLNELIKNNFFPRPFFYHLTSIPAYKKINKNFKKFKTKNLNAYRTHTKGLVLPSSYILTKSQIQKISNIIIKNFFKKND